LYNAQASEVVAGQFMRKYQCNFCGYVYDEAAGDPESGVAPGTRWEDIPDDWYCPSCGAAKSDFAMVEIT
jgi:rubredoxin